MSDRHKRDLERTWLESGAPTDGIAFYRDLARLGPLPCPACRHPWSLARIGREHVLDHVRDQGAQLTLVWGYMAQSSGLNYEVVMGALGSLESCAKCGTVWNPTAPLVAEAMLGGRGPPTPEAPQGPERPGPEASWEDLTESWRGARVLMPWTPCGRCEHGHEFHQGQCTSTGCSCSAYLPPDWCDSCLGGGNRQHVPHRRGCRYRT